ncbi:MAG: glycosyltransferase [Polyangiaceae bacterium]
MYVGIATVGSRGDVQPYLALAVALSRRGHRVRLATCSPFEALARAHGIEFVSIGGDIKEIVGDAGREALMRAESHPIKAARALRAHVGPLVRQGLDALPEALDGCDAIVGQMLAPGAAHTAERRGVPYFDACYDPVFPTRAFAHPGAPRTIPRGWASYATYVAAEQVFWQAFRPDIDAFRARIGLGRAPFFGPTRRASRRPRTLLGYSRAIAPVPADWPAHVTATGPWLLDAPRDWAPPADLARFLAEGPPPVFVGFGSMTVEDPAGLTRAIVRALRAVGLRGVLSTGWGALAPATGVDMFNVGDVPHRWLFPRMACVIHHGGPSTTADGLLAGVPQFVAPFLSDQPFWGARVAVSGAGPEPVPIAKLTEEHVRCARVAMAQPDMRRRARELAALQAKERGAEDAARAIERALGHAP